MTAPEELGKDGLMRRQRCWLKVFAGLMRYEEASMPEISYREIEPSGNEPPNVSPLETPPLKRMVSCALAEVTLFHQVGR